MKTLIASILTATLLALSTPVFADCGTGQVSYLRSSQREQRGTDFRLTVQADATPTADYPVVDVRTTFVGETGSIDYTFTLSRNAGLPEDPTARAGWSYEDRTDTTYTRIRLNPNGDGTSTLRVAMRVPYTTIGNGLGYYASIRSCE